MGVVVEDCGASKEFKVECDRGKPAIEDAVLSWEYEGGGGYVGDPACRVVAIWAFNGSLRAVAVR